MNFSKWLISSWKFNASFLRLNVTLEISFSSLNLEIEGCNLQVIIDIPHFRFPFELWLVMHLPYPALTS